MPEKIVPITSPCRNDELGEWQECLVRTGYLHLHQDLTYGSDMRRWSLVVETEVRLMRARKRMVPWAEFCICSLHEFLYWTDA